MSVETITQIFQQEAQDPTVQQQLQSASDRNTFKFELTQSDLANIVATASSLSERLNNEFLNVDAAQINQQNETDTRLNRWCQIVAQGNWETFQKRLQWNGLDLNKVRQVISDAPVNENPTLPDWGVTLKEVIQTAAQFQDKYKQELRKSPLFLGKIVDLEPEIYEETKVMTSTCVSPDKITLEPENPLPFEELLLPAVYVARQKLLTHLGSDSLSPTCLPLELLSEESYLELELNLLSLLVSLCENTLEFEFAHFRPFGQSLLNLLVKDIKLTPQKTQYQAFVQELLQDGMLAFFQKYPVLGKLLATRIDLWVEATGEFLQRLKADLPEINRLFQAESKSSEELPISQLGKVIQISPNLSDPHNRGRSAIALTFESQLKLIYKPKDLGLDVAYNQLLDWCNQQGVALSFKIIKILNRQTYGWVEYVEHLPIEDAAAAQRFYQRTGMILCLLYVLGATDCHYENLIASGEHLVLIDMETLIHHEAKMEDFPEQQQQIALNRYTLNQQFSDSVLRTGLLPWWDFNKDKSIAYDISGLGSINSEVLTLQVMQWNFVNTDNMHRAIASVTMPLQKNVPVLNGIPLSPNNYLEQLVFGFEEMYRFLIEQRETLLAESSLLTALRSQQVRFVFRHTKVYAVILQNSLAPQFLQNGIDWSIELDILARAFIIAEHKPNAWSILNSEIRAMEQLDIPYFAAYSDSDALTFGLNQPLERYFKAPSYSQVINRLQNLDRNDLTRQVAMIRGSFYAKVAHLPKDQQTLIPNSLLSLTLKGAATQTKTAQAVYNNIGGTDEDDCILSLQGAAFTKEGLLASAGAIAEEICSHAIKEASGSVSWIGLSYIPKAERFQLQPLNESLYDGNCGIAMFLAALDYVRGSSELRDLALGALQSLREILQTTDTQLMQLAKKIGIGGATGLGAIAYSLVKISHFLKKPALIEDARRFANLITPQMIAADKQLDVMNGAAGSILGLLTLYRETADLEILEKAIACGQHLLSERISIDNSHKAWKTIADQPLTGFSHGAAGIAYALLRLYAVTNDKTYLAAAKEGIAYERSVFFPSAANWPDFCSSQQNGQPGYIVSWCHGAAGIGLARLGALSILETEEIYQDLEVALQTTQKYPLQGVDNLCCGNFGRFELLLVGYQKLSRPELLEIACKKAAQVAAAKLGEYKLFGSLPNHVFSPSFFQGTAGIGYQLLRLAYPELLPSVLLWQ